MNSVRRPSANLLPLLLIVLVVILILLLFTCHREKELPSGTPNTGNTIPPPSQPPPTGLQIPQINPGDEIVKHEAYTLCYREDYEQAAWVAYVATGAHTLAAHVSRTNQFQTDPLVSTGSATNADYETSGYDRGHLAPAEDMGWSKKTMAESFYYSNMSPQVPAFNRGVWKRLEELVRYWSTVYDSIYIVTGPVLTPGLPVIGSDKVSVPAYYYKVVLVYNAKGAQAIGFLLPNEASAATLKSFALPVDSIEQRTGLDFFPQLPDKIEAEIESRDAVQDWPWTRVKP